mmetsp:Transcript_20690/g.54827  ORF Transcript_20690/g.54827 Transcript_20690/m.54827 type:complete len:259 (-) Transcript_20690:1194-1970(-)
MRNSNTLRRKHLCCRHENPRSVLSRATGAMRPICEALRRLRLRAMAASKSHCAVNPMGCRASMWFTCRFFSDALASRAFASASRVAWQLSKSWCILRDMSLEFVLSASASALPVRSVRPRPWRCRVCKVLFVAKASATATPVWLLSRFAWTLWHSSVKARRPLFALRESASSCPASSSMRSLFKASDCNVLLTSRALASSLSVPAPKLPASFRPCTLLFACMPLAMAAPTSSSAPSACIGRAPSVKDCSDWFSVSISL